MVFTTVTIKCEFIVVYLSCNKNKRVNLFPDSCISSYLRAIRTCFCDYRSPSSGSTCYPKVSGFGGQEAACWPLVPKFAG